MSEYPGFIDLGRWPYGWSPSGPGWDYPDEAEEPDEPEEDLENETEEEKE